MAPVSIIFALLEFIFHLAHWCQCVIYFFFLFINIPVCACVCVCFCLDDVRKRKHERKHHASVSDSGKFRRHCRADLWLSVNWGSHRAQTKRYPTWSCSETSAFQVSLNLFIYRHLCVSACLSIIFFLSTVSIYLYPSVCLSVYLPQACSIEACVVNYGSWIVHGERVRSPSMCRLLSVLIFCLSTSVSVSRRDSHLLS